MRAMHWKRHWITTGQGSFKVFSSPTLKQSCQLKSTMLVHPISIRPPVKGPVYRCQLQSSALFLWATGLYGLQVYGYGPKTVALTITCQHTRLCHTPYAISKTYSAITLQNRLLKAHFHLTEGAVHKPPQWNNALCKHLNRENFKVVTH